jgi:hypothetical protein
VDKIRIWDGEAIARGSEQDVPDTERRPGESPAEWNIRMLLKHLQALAAEPDVVFAAYPADCDVAEVLPDDFTEYLDRCWWVIRDGLVAEDYLDGARQVGRQLSEMYDREDPALWTHDALRRRPEWAALRRLAADALAAMGYDLEPPPPRSL